MCWSKNLPLKGWGLGAGETEGRGDGVLFLGGVDVGRRRPEISGLQCLRRINPAWGWSQQGCCGG